MDLNKELEEVMAANTEWKGSSEQVWLRVKDEIRSRQRRKWQIPAWGAAAAAALFVAVTGTKVFFPGNTLHPNPPFTAGEQAGQPPVFAPPSESSDGRWSAGFRMYDTLPGFLYYSKTVLVGDVVAETDIEIPPTEDQWRTYRDSQTPPPPDHPKAKFWKPPAPPKPTPAKLFTVKVTEGIKGIASGETVTMQQLNVTDANAGSEPLLQVGKKYVLFPMPAEDGVYGAGAPYLEVSDNKLHLVTLAVSPIWTSDAGSDSFLRELDGVDVEQGLKKVRFATEAESAIAAALSVVPSGVPFDLAAFPRYVGTRGGCVAVGDQDLSATYESSVWPMAGGGNEVRMIRLVKLDGTEHQTTWTFQVKSNGSVDGPVRSGSDLEVSRCAAVP